MKSFWKKALMSAAIAALAVGTLSGCGGGDKKGEAPKGNPKEITVYMGVVEKQAKVLADEFKKDTGIEVKFVRMSGGETLSRIRAEKQAPKADAWYGGSADSYIVAANEGLLEAYKSPIGTPQNPMPVSPISRPLKIPIIVTMPNFLTLVRNSMNGMPVIKDHNAPRIGKKIGTKPTGMATQQPMTK